MALNILGYLVETKEYGLRFDINAVPDYNYPEIATYCEADLGGQEAAADPPKSCDCRSTTGTVLMMNKNVIGFKSKKQTCIARSSTESELYSIAAVIILLQFIRRLLNEIFSEGSVLNKTKLYSDNLNALSTIQTGFLSSANRH
jgi:hypothetical protein